MPRRTYRPEPDNSTDADAIRAPEGTRPGALPPDAYPEPGDPAGRWRIPERMQRASTVVTRTPSGRIVVRVRWRVENRTREATYPHRGAEAARGETGDALTLAALRRAFPDAERFDPSHAPEGAPEQRWKVLLRPARLVPAPATGYKL